MRPNYDKRAKSRQELQAETLLEYLPASIEQLRAIFSVSRQEMLTYLASLKRQGLATSTVDKEHWYRVRVEKGGKL